MELGQLPLQRNHDGQLQMAGCGPVTLQIHHNEIIGSGGQGTVYKGRICNIQGAPVLEVRKQVVM